MSLSSSSARADGPQALRNATHRAAAALSEMAEREIRVGEVETRMVALSQITNVAGDPERPVVAVHVGVDGFGGHILLAMSEEMARRLVDMLLMGLPDSTTQNLGEMEASALAEAGNVTGTLFLTALAEAAERTLPPTPPV